MSALSYGLGFRAAPLSPFFPQNQQMKDDKNKQTWHEISLLSARCGLQGEGACPSSPVALAQSDELAQVILARGSQGIGF